jgi:OHCU decarboxylase
VLRPFAGVNELFAAMKSVVDRAPEEVLIALIRVHPDLANKTQRAAGLTAESNAEQNGAGLDRLSDAEFLAFERVNNAYRAKFGFPYIVCVRRHTRDSILRDFERRLPNDAKAEAQTSIGKSAGSRRCVSISLLRPKTGCPRTVACRPMCWTPQRQACGGGSRSNSQNCPISARPAWWRVRRRTMTAAPISR